jgi:hypothetical protein
MTADKNIFEFYGSTNDNTSLGVVVEGLNFEFDSAIATSNGYALYFPATNDIGGGTLFSNSHYIRRNRFGGWHRKGRFIYLANSNDVEISANVVDVTASHAIVLGDQTLGGPTDVRIFGNNFYNSLTGVAIYSGSRIAIVGNNFTQQFNGSGWASVRCISSTGKITPGKIDGVVIGKNTFFEQYNSLEIDGSAHNVQFVDNVAVKSWHAPIHTIGATDVKQLTVAGNRFQLDSGYALAYAPLQITGGGKIVDSEIVDNTVDANGVNGVVSFMNDDTTASWLGSGIVYRNNKIINNTSVPFAIKTFIPMSAEDLLIKNARSFGSHPTAQDVFSLNTVAVGDYVSFELLWEVIVDQSGVNTSVRKGTTRITIARLGRTLVADVTSVSSVATDVAGAGGGVLPTVTWAVSTSAPSAIRVTVTSTLTPTSVTVNATARNFSGSGAALIKST